WILWTISQDVLVAQFDADFCGNIGQVVWIVDGKGAASGELGDITQEAGAEALFFSGEIMIVDADGVDEYIGLFHGGANLTFSVAAVIVTAVRDDEQSLLWKPGLAHLAHA